VRIETQAVHAGDRKKLGPYIPVTTPVYTAATYIYESTAEIDRVFGHQQPGYAYSRWDSPNNAALEEVLTVMEGGHGSLACASGMVALHTALHVAMLGRPRSVLAAEAIYGATVGMLQNHMEPAGVRVRFADLFDADAFRRALAEHRPGAILIESVSNPLLRVAPIDTVAAMAREAGAALIVDNTFATPLLMRPIEMGAHFVVHSLTKYLAGHGDVLGGSVTCDEAHYEPLRAYSRAVGPVLGPFESYLALRGIKTFPLRMERQCANAEKLAAWLATHPRIERVYYPGDPAHPDRATIERLFPRGLYGAMVSFEIRGAGREEVFRFLDALRLVVRATSLGDVHTMALYPFISSHRDVAPEMKARMGIGQNLVRLSAGIEAMEDVIADLAQALGYTSARK
jgi:cystathionine gamma-synthase/methionine-gamma-lyase